MVRGILKLQEPETRVMFLVKKRDDLVKGGCSSMIDVSKHLSVGQNYVMQKVVQPEDTASKYLGQFKFLLSSTRFIHWCIDASIETMDPYLPVGYASVGLAFHVVHDAPTCAGMKVSIHVTIIDVTDNIVTLSIKAWDEMGEIAHGTHRRSVVEVEALNQKAKDRMKLISSKRILSWSKK